MVDISDGEPSGSNLPGTVPHARANFPFDIRGITEQKFSKLLLIVYGIDSTQDISD